MRPRPNLQPFRGTVYEVDDRGYPTARGYVRQYDVDLEALKLPTWSAADVFAMHARAAVLEARIKAGDATPVLLAFGPITPPWRGALQ